MDTKGKFFWKQTWYSYCSMHHETNKDCDICKHGSWEYTWLIAIRGFFHDNCYWLWYWWVNKK